MKHIVILIHFLIFTLLSYGQSPESGDVSAKDSLELLNIWKQFISTVQNKDTVNFNNLSTKIITLTNYYGKDSGYKVDFLRDSVRNILFKGLLSSKVWNLIEQNKCTLSFGTSRDFQRYKLKKTKIKKYTIFEIAFENNQIKPDATFGIACSFDFIKTDNVYYFNELSVHKY